MGRWAERRAGSPRRFRAEAKDARSVHLGDGLSVGARERPRSGLLPVASRSSTPTVAQREDSHTPLASTAIFRIKSVTPLVGLRSLSPRGCVPSWLRGLSPCLHGRNTLKMLVLRSYVEMRTRCGKFQREAGECVHGFHGFARIEGGGFLRTCTNLNS